MLHRGHLLITDKKVVNARIPVLPVGNYLAEPEVMMRKKILQLVLFSSLCWSSAILAIQDGKLGRTSDVRISIGLHILPIIQIGKVGDIALNIADRTVDVSYSGPICVKGNAGNRYAVTATGSGTGSDPFTLKNQDGGSLAYHVFYRGLTSAIDDELTSGATSPHYDLPSLITTCGDTGSTLTVTFLSEDLVGLASGLYTGSLTLVVSPL